MTFAATIRSFVAAGLLLLSAAHAQRQVEPMGDGPQPNVLPRQLEQIRIDQRLGQQLPLDATFRDESGKQVRLGDYFGKKPVILTFVYYECPMLCTQVLNGLVSAVDILKFDIGREYDIVTISIDPVETPAMAAAKKKMYLDRYKRAGANKGWHFLVGDQQNVKAVTEAAGFYYAYDPVTKQFAHASAIMVVTADGHMAQYYYGLEYSPKDLRLALVEASENKIGNVVDQLLLYCYHYDPATGKYGAVAMNILRLAGAATVLVLGGFMAVMFRRDLATSRSARRLERKA
jgi:protein SCO1